MTTTIWILKGIIALIFTFTGTYKLIFPKSKLLASGMKGLINLSEGQIKVTGLLELLGAAGLILPALLNIYPILSTISAICLGLTMVVAAAIHIKLKLSIVPNIVILIICVVIAIGSVMTL